MNSVKKGDFVELICRTDSNIRLEEEVVLPDYCSDVAKILRLVAVPIVEKTRAYIQDNTVCTELVGRVEFQLLFTNDEGECECYGFSKDFSESTKKALEKGSACIPDSLCVSLSFTNITSSPKALSPRKILARSEIGCRAHVFANVEYSFYNPSEDVAQHRVAPLKNEHGIARIVASCDEDFSLVQEIKLPSSMPPCARLLSCSASINVDSTHPSLDSVSVFSTISVNVFYLSEPNETGEVEYVSFYQPIEVKEKIELDDSGEDSVCRIRGLVGKLVCTPVADAFGENKLFSLSLGYTLSACIMENVCTELVCDAYGVGCEAECKTDTREFSNFLGALTQSQAFREELTLKSSYKSLCGVCGRAYWKKTFVLDRQAFLEIGVEVFAILINDDGKIDTSVSESFDTTVSLNIPDSITKSADIESLVIDGSATLSFVDCTLSGAKIEVSGELAVGAQIFEKNKIKFILDTELGPQNKKRDGIVFYYPTKTDTLWSIGKQYGVEVEAIKQTNKIEDERVPSVIRIP